MTQKKAAASVTRLRTASTKLFVLDTNVLMHDPTSLFRFEEHDVFLPMVTLEELDAHKKGMSEVSRNARQASRYLDERPTSPAARRSTRRARPRPDGCTCRPSSSPRHYRRRSRPARPTTRSSAWSSICRTRTRRGR